MHNLILFSTSVCFILGFLVMSSLPRSSCCSLCPSLLCFAYLPIYPPARLCHSISILQTLYIFLPRFHSDVCPLLHPHVLFPSCFFRTNLELHEITFYQSCSRAILFRSETLAIYRRWKHIFFLSSFSTLILFISSISFFCALHSYVSLSTFKNHPPVFRVEFNHSFYSCTLSTPVSSIILSLSAI